MSKKIESGEPKEIIEVRSLVVEQMEGVGEIVSIKNDMDLDRAVLAHQKAKSAAKLVKARKEFLTKPLNAALKSWREVFKGVEDHIEEEESRLEGLILAYRKKKDEAANKKEEALAEKVSTGEISAEKAVEKMENIQRAEISGSHVRKVPTLEIFDLALIPREYLVPDTVKIKEAIKSGLEVPGAKMVDREILV